MKFFSKQKAQPKPLVIEVEKALRVQDQASKSAVQTLQHHMGFLYLLNKLKLEKAYLQALLAQAPKESIDRLQAGIFWINYIENFVSREGAIPSAQPTEALEHEIAAFNEAARNFEIVGA